MYVWRLKRMRARVCVCVCTKKALVWNLNYSKRKRKGNPERSSRRENEKAAPRRKIIARKKSLSTLLWACAKSDREGYGISLQLTFYRSVTVWCHTLDSTAQWWDGHHQKRRIDKGSIKSYIHQVNDWCLVSWLSLDAGRQSRFLGNQIVQCALGGYKDNVVLVSNRRGRHNLQSTMEEESVKKKGRKFKQDFE